MISNVCLIVPCVLLCTAIILGLIYKIPTIERALRYTDFDIIFLIIIILMVAIGLLWLVCDIIEIGTFQANETRYFQKMLVERETLQKIIDTGGNKDIASTQVYIKVVDYNMEVASCKEYMTSPKFSICAKACKCDWLSLEYINFN